MGGDGTSLRLKARVDGERVLELPPSSARITGIALDGGLAMAFIQKGGHLAVVLPEPTRSGAEIALHFAYDAEQLLVFAPLFPRDVAPASYRDQWIIDGISSYAAAERIPSG